MVGVARSINECKRQHEKAARVTEVQSLLAGYSDDDLASLGELLLEVNDDHYAY